MKKYAVISMDVEDWYHTYFPDWNVDRSISLMDGLDNCLHIMDCHQIRGSFFVIGEIAHQVESRLQHMDLMGHDIACHGNIHIRPLSLSDEQFRSQLLTSKQTLEQILGHPITGYRAPSFAIGNPQLEIVKEAGFRYDSSRIKPQKSQKYGHLDLSDFTSSAPCIYHQGDFTELEVSTQPIGNFNMLLGGGYLRMLPWCFIKFMTRRYLRTGNPYIMYIHPIDLSDHPIPHVDHIGLSKYLRTHLGRRHMKKRFEKLIQLLQNNGYEFVTLEQLRKIQANNTEGSEK